MKKIFRGKILKANDNILTIELEETLPKNIEEYEVKVEKITKKRGLDANSLAWTLIDRISEKLNLSRNVVYDKMLESYGVAMYMVVKPTIAERALKTFEHGRILGDVMVDGKKGTQLQIFLGSSQYTREEFAHFLSGIISECEQMDLVIPSKDVFIDALERWD